MVSFHLVYSDGGVDREHTKDFPNLYSIALFPFLMNVPSADVQLIIQRGYQGFSDDNVETVADFVSITREEKIEYFPHGYHDYFLSIYHSSKGPAELSVVPDVRLVSGHGFGSYAGSSIQMGKEEISYKEIRPARVLTILDTCNSAHALACMTGIFPDNPRSFNSSFRKKMFKDANIPLVCDRNEYVWAFQIGPIGRHRDITQGRGLEDCSLAFGDTVVCCLVLALRSFANDSSVALGKYFESEYEGMNDAYLPSDIFQPKPFARLTELQGLVKDGTLSVNVEAIDNCEIFKRRPEWFLSTEKPLQLSPSDTELATRLIEYVVTSVSDWHELNPDATTNIDSSVVAFKELVKMLGQHSTQIRQIRLDYKDDQSKVVQDEEGVEFQSWAISCSAMPQILQKVRKAIHDGDISAEE